MAARKRWRTVQSGTAKVDRFLSEAGTYDHVDILRRSWAAGEPESVGALTVQVDEGDGLGWQTYEFINFAEEAA